ncbi:MAG: hypothetical protein EPO08_02685 [Rhodospirillaceae bacterium]|nr:MAG: hypothetical protein EPO08_02685 [Rhodospirillaceae bacterium]
MSTAAPLFLATSLVPGGDRALQTAAVESWRTAGFTVLSVNAASEIPALTCDYPGVTLVAAPATGERLAGKPVPYIHDLLKSLRRACAGHGAPLADCTVGVINADIHLRFSADDIGICAAGARDSVLLGPRVDVPSMAALGAYTPTGTETYSVGYDYFLMSGNVLEDFSDSPFCLGMPFWDYWLPLIALLKGRQLKALLAPVALHVAHETRWDNSIYVFFHALIADVMEVCRISRERDKSATSRQFDLLYDILSHVYADVFARGTQAAKNTTEPDPAGIAALAAFYDRFQEVVVHHIKSRAVPLALATKVVSTTP